MVSVFSGIKSAFRLCLKHLQPSTHICMQERRVNMYKAWRKKVISDTGFTAGNDEVLMAQPEPNTRSHAGVNDEVLMA